MKFVKRSLLQTKDLYKQGFPDLWKIFLNNNNNN